MKGSISEMVFKVFKEKGLRNKKAKDFAFLIPIVKKQFPKSKFKQTHLSWYLSKARSQKKLDCLHVSRA